MTEMQPEAATLMLSKWKYQCTDLNVHLFLPFIWVITVYKFIHHEKLYSCSYSVKIERKMLN